MASTQTRIALIGSGFIAEVHLLALRSVLGVFSGDAGDPEALERTMSGASCVLHLATDAGDDATKDESMVASGGVPRAGVRAKGRSAVFAP